MENTTKYEIFKKEMERKFAVSEIGKNKIFIEKQIEKFVNDANERGRKCMMTAR